MKHSSEGVTDNPCYTSPAAGVATPLWLLTVPLVKLPHMGKEDTKELKQFANPKATSSALAWTLTLLILAKVLATAIVSRNAIKGTTTTPDPKWDTIWEVATVVLPFVTVREGGWERKQTALQDQWHQSGTLIVAENHYNMITIDLFEIWPPLISIN